MDKLASCVVIRLSLAFQLQGQASGSSLRSRFHSGNRCEDAEEATVGVLHGAYREATNCAGERTRKVGTYCDKCFASFGKRTVCG